MTLPVNTVLLVIDMQKGFDDPSWGHRSNSGMEANVASLLEFWRASERLVFHVKHMSTSLSSPLRPDQPGNDFKIESRPMPGEVIFEKRTNSAFIGTTLEANLRERGCANVVIAGLTTNHCVSTTARMAGNLDFRTWVISDATATFDRTGPDGITYSAEQIHAIALADLHGEFATVSDTKTIIKAAQIVQRRAR